MTIFPLWVHKLTLRLQNLTKRHRFLTVHLYTTDGETWYLVVGDGEPECLGKEG